MGLRGNPLSAASLGQHVPALRARGVAVLALPYFPAASEGGGREGFARVSNRSARPGVAMVTGVDDAGVAGGEVRLTIPVGAARTLTAARMSRVPSAGSGTRSPPRARATRRS